MTTVSTAPLKRKALGLPEPVKSLILSEPDSMDAGELIGKVGTWEKLLKMAQNTRS